MDRKTSGADDFAAASVDRFHGTVGGGVPSDAYTMAASVFRWHCRYGLGVFKYTGSGFA